MKTNNVFMSLKNTILTPLVQGLLLIIPFFITWRIADNWHLSFFVACLVYYFVMVMMTILFLRVYITIFPFNEGKFNNHDHPMQFYHWSLWSYLYASNLFFISDNILIPPMFRKTIYGWLGAKTGKGILLICATISDPALLEIEENVIIGEGSVIFGHLITPPDKLMLGKVVIKKGALIGAMSFISPGVTIGENSLLKMSSVVYPNTVIPPNEVWGGNPAVKIKNLEKHNND